MLELTRFNPYNPKVETAAHVAIAIPTKSHTFLLINIWTLPFSDLPMVRIGGTTSGLGYLLARDNSSRRGV
ncbi:hypothetical protein [Propionivibrio soli]|uniref:hypothetical protein n=1 Tax=Propionivibrio soli TaxID=2976531 RepID=UPI0021E9807A|nr:hypothetical protein [Propionivibrio soli]